MRIRELMTTDVETIGPDEPLKEAARRMVQHGIGGLPVVDDEGALVGIITESDFVDAEAGRRSNRRAKLLRFFDRPEEFPDRERSVSDVMTPVVHTVAPDSDHTEAARLMQSKGVKRLPVVDSGRVVGVVSRADLMRSFTRSDEAILEEIQDHVIRKVLWIDPSKVQVTSSDGDVTLAGRLETKSDADLMIELVRRLDGVASVSSSLAWEVDNTREDMTGRPHGRGPRPNW